MGNGPLPGCLEVGASRSLLLRLESRLAPVPSGLFRALRTEPG